MSLKDLEIQPSYETLEGTDPVNGFYVPALAESVEYDRSVGFFSSASLALAARGVAGLIHNRGKMRLVVSPHLSERDVAIIRQAESNPESVIESIMSEVLMDVDALAGEIEHDHVRALGWMLANGYLELRIACVIDENGDILQDQLFHQKVGILRDAEGYALSFSGSINETASGWLFNSEEFKVFKSWDEGQRGFFESDERKFSELWNNQRERVMTFEPKGSLSSLLVAEGKDFDIECSSLAKTRAARNMKRISLFPYQREAFKTWRCHEGQLLFEMATGTGKTRTALACVQDLLIAKPKLVCVIATPQSTLSRQWEREVSALGLKFDTSIFADSSAGTSASWASSIRAALGRIAIGIDESLIVYTTHASAANELFIKAIEGADPSLAVCLVGDEVHGMGSREQRKALLERYTYRIGLSATPSRWFDEEGSALLRSYFGGQSFEFTIKDAQETVNPLAGETFLCPYQYHLETVGLSDDEAEKFDRLTKQIAKLSHQDDDAARERLDQLLRKRALIKKNAVAKLDGLDALLDHIEHEDLLVFTSPQRIDEVESILGRHGVAAHRFTQQQGTRPKREFGGLSERDYLIKMFKEGVLQALVAIKCLDEGIDIPQAKSAILLSSSTNPREYVQRVGRVIRRSPGKNLAHIYDFVVVPDWSRLELYGDIESERRLFNQELVRIEDMRKNAVNSTDVLIKMRGLLGRAYGD